VMPRVVSQEHLRGASLLRKYLAKYNDIELLLQLGEYKRGADADADFAIEHIAAMRGLLRQPPNALSRFDEATHGLRSLFG